MKLKVTILIIFMLAGCPSFRSYKTKITITGGPVPTFGLSSSGTMVDFTIRGPRQRAGEHSGAFIVWELRPIGNTDDIDDLNGIGSIKYGEIPKGYKQVYPENNSPPPPLLEGEHYLLQIYTNNAPWGQIAFEIRDGKAVERPIK
jgi:hypothetical protein